MVVRPICSEPAIHVASCDEAYMKVAYSTLPIGASEAEWEEVEPIEVAWRKRGGVYSRI